LCVIFLVFPFMYTASSAATQIPMCWRMLRSWDRTRTVVTLALTARRPLTTRLDLIYNSAGSHPQLG
jgi:hypothetical protein